jgi:hypothetical protein
MKKYCDDCSSPELTWLDYRLTCLECGNCHDIPYFDEDEPDYSPSFVETKIDNIQCWNWQKFLLSLGGEETRKIPNNVLEEVDHTLKERELEYNQQNILKILKENKRYALYNHCAVICKKLTSQPQPQIPYPLQSRLIDDFRRITIRFPYIRPSHRKYLPNYNFILRKLLRLKGYYELADQFTTLSYKTPKKLREVEDIFDKLVQELDLC